MELIYLLEDLVDDRLTNGLAREGRMIAQPEFPDSTWGVQVRHCLRTKATQGGVRR